MIILTESGGKFTARLLPSRSSKLLSCLEKLEIQLKASKHIIVARNTPKTGEIFLLTVGAFFLTVELLCLQSVEVLLRHTVPL